MDELIQLYKELGQLSWVGEDEGWDLAVEAIRKRITTLISAKMAATIKSINTHVLNGGN